MSNITPTTTFILRGRTYGFVADQYDQEHVDENKSGARAIIYRVEDVQTRDQYALKCFKDEFMQSYTAASFDFMQQQLADIPALQWIRQRVRINTDQDSSLLTQFAFMQNAILMPWVAGKKLAELRMEIKAGKRTVPPPLKCRKIVQHLVESLATLEDRGFAHGDLAASNILINWEHDTVSLIDIEDMYHGEITEPTNVFKSGSGTSGYRFSRNFRSWLPQADRFAASIVIAEIISLSDRQALITSQIETLFSQQTLDQRIPANSTAVRDLVITNVINAMRKLNFHTILEDALTAKLLTEVPPLQVWANKIGVKIIDRNRVSYPVVHISPTEIELPGPIEPYCRPANSEFPTLLVFLLDLSRSMFLYTVKKSGVNKEVTRYELAIDLMTNIMRQLVSRSKIGEIILPRYHFAVCGYNKETKNLFSSKSLLGDGRSDEPSIRNGIYSLDMWRAQNSFSSDKMHQAIEFGKTDPKGETHMTQAFQHVHTLIAENIHAYQHCHPPYVLHITDGANNDDGDPFAEFQKITALTTNHGNTLMATAYIGEEAFSAGEITQGVTQDTRFVGKRAGWANYLRNISSPMPNAYIQELRKQPKYANLSSDAIMFFPGNQPDMIELAINTTIATGK